MLHSSDKTEEDLKAVEEMAAGVQAGRTQTPPAVEITRSETPSGEAIDERYEAKPESTPEALDTQDGKQSSVENANEAVEEVEEEMAESVTEIEEIFQVSEDGVNWKTVKKITTITPQGTSERVIILGGI